MTDPSQDMNAGPGPTRSMRWSLAVALALVGVAAWFALQGQPTPAPPYLENGPDSARTSPPPLAPADRPARSASDADGLRAPPTSLLERRLEGIVLRDAGDPAADGVAVRVRRSALHGEVASVLTDAHGRFALDVPEAVSYAAWAETGSSVSPVQWWTPASKALVLRLRQGCRVSGRVGPVRDPSDPPGTAHVLVHWRLGPGHTLRADEFGLAAPTWIRATVDAEGGFSVVVPSRGGRVTAWAVGGDPSVLGPPVAVEMGAQCDLDIGSVMPPSAPKRMRIAVRGPDGRPVPGAVAASAPIGGGGRWVNLSAPDRTGDVATVWYGDDAGVIALGPFDGGAVLSDLVVGAPGFRAAIVSGHAWDPDRHVEVRLAPRSMLDVTVSGLPHPLASDRLQVRAAKSSAHPLASVAPDALEVLEEELGDVEVSELPDGGSGRRLRVDGAGTYRLTARIDEEVFADRVVKVGPDGSVTRVHVEAPPGRRWIELRLPGDAPAYSRVWVQPRDSTGPVAGAGRSLAFPPLTTAVWTSVPSGTTALVIEGRTGVDPPFRAIDVPLGPDPVVDLPGFGPAPESGVRIILEDRRGRPLTGVGVALRDHRTLGDPERPFARRGWRREIVGPDGSLEVALPPGAYRVQWDPQLAPCAWIPFEVIEGSHASLRLVFPSAP